MVSFLLFVRTVCCGFHASEALFLWSCICPFSCCLFSVFLENWTGTVKSFLFCLFVLILLLVLEILENEQIMTNEFQKTVQESCVKCPSSGIFYHVSFTSTNEAWSKGFEWFRIHAGSMLLSSFLDVNTSILVYRINLRMVWDEMIAEVFWVLKHSGMLPAT